MARRALIVGIDTYAGGDGLMACAADATAVAHALARHKNGEKNFDCELLADETPSGATVTRPRLRAALTDLFAFDGVVLFYFSGHGFLSRTGGWLGTSDGTRDDWGISMHEIVDLALQSPAREVLLVLDCCYGGDLCSSGALGGGAGRMPLATLRENLTVMAASRSRQEAVAVASRSCFTAALLDALEGGAADHMGFVTAPAVYAYVDRRFSPLEQRPVFKTNATEVLVVRRCEPLIDQLRLRRLAALFPTADFRYRLDPEYEPEDEHGRLAVPLNEEKVEIARLFKTYRDVGLLRPSNPNHQLYWAARACETVELTPRGREYWWLTVNGKI